MSQTRQPAGAQQQQQQRQMWSQPASAAASSAIFFPPVGASSASASSFVSKDSPAAVAAAQRKKLSKAAAATMWTCATCTFSNKATRDGCEMCETPNIRAVDPPVAAIVAASKAAEAAKQPAPVNGVKPRLPTPSPAPAPVLISPVTQAFRSVSYENGLIAACNNITYDEVMRRQLIGLPRANYDLVMRMKHKASAIFLLNLESKELYGVFEAEGAPGVDLEPDAWAGQASANYKGVARSSRFPVQCRFTMAADFETPLAERHYREMFTREPNKKIRNLTAEEVKKLIKIFQAKSKMRKIAVAAPVQPVAPTPAPAAPVAAVAPATAASASAASVIAAAPAAVASASTSRRGSIDSTTSEDDKKKRRTAAKIQQTCKRWLADECVHSDDTCKYLHVPSLCRAFQRGTCPKGSHCPFVHDKQDREHYKHGRNYCQKTAVHADAAPVPLSTKPKPSQAPPKDSLDSILSGLGSWKISRKASEPEPQDTLDDEELAQEDLQHLEDDAQEFEQEEPEFDDDGGVTFEQATPAGAQPLGGHPASQLFMDGGLSFDMPSALSASAGAPGGMSQSQSSQGWSGYDASSDAHAAFDSDGSGMFFAPPSGAAGASFAPPPAGPSDEEFAWFTHFRTQVVQPALQAVHAREQASQQKIIGPD